MFDSCAFLWVNFLLFACLANVNVFFSNLILFYFVMVSSYLLEASSLIMKDGKGIDLDGKGRTGRNRGGRIRIHFVWKGSIFDKRKTIFFLLKKQKAWIPQKSQQQLCYSLITGLPKQTFVERNYLWQDGICTSNSISLFSEPTAIVHFPLSSQSDGDICSE